MHGDLCCLPRMEAPAGAPVPGNLVPRLIHRGHDRIRLVSSPDEEPEPSLMGEGDTSTSPVVEIVSTEVQDGRSRLIDEFAYPGGSHQRHRVDHRSRGVVPVSVLPAAGGDLGDARRPGVCGAAGRDFRSANGEAPPGHADRPGGGNPASSIGGWRAVEKGYRLLIRRAQLKLP